MHEIMLNKYTISQSKSSRRNVVEIFNQDNYNLRAVYGTFRVEEIH